MIVGACAAIARFSYPNVEAMFYLLGAGGLTAALLAITIPESAINHSRARQLNETEEESRTDEESGINEESETDGSPPPSPSRYSEILANKSIMLFAVLTFTYHLANAGAVPLLAQYIAKITPDEESLTWTSAVLLVGFLSQAITAFGMGYVVDSYNHKKIMTVAFVMLPLRCFLFAALVEFLRNPWALTLVQVLDGIGAGVYDMMIPLIVQKMVMGSGRFGFTFGIIVSVWRIGHGVSVLAGESIVQAYGYTAAFISLGALGVLNLIVFSVFFRFDYETKEVLEEGDKDIEETGHLTNLTGHSTNLTGHLTNVTEDME